jgi:hypothetical protein
MTVDRQARASYAELIRRFLECEITNEEFHNKTPLSPTSDRAIREIFGELWYCYDDIIIHKADGKHGLNERERELFERCAAFLQSELEYEWPQIHTFRWGGLLLSLARLVANIVTLGLFGKWRRGKFLAAMHRIGDYSVWPFLRKEDWERQRATARLGRWQTDRQGTA